MDGYPDLSTRLEYGTGVSLEDELLPLDGSVMCVVTPTERLAADVSDYFSEDLAVRLFSDSILSSFRKFDLPDGMRPVGVHPFVQRSGDHFAVWAKIYCASIGDKEKESNQ